MFDTFRRPAPRPLPYGMVAVRFMATDSRGFTMHYDDFVVTPDRAAAALRLLALDAPADTGEIPASAGAGV